MVADSTLVDTVMHETEGSITMRSSEVDNPRGGYAHHEHRRPDGWTSTPRGKDDDEASSQPLVRIGGEGAHDNIKSTGCGSSCDLPAGERLPKQRPLGDEHPESGLEEHLVAQKFPQVEEAGSIVSQFSRSSSVFKNEGKEMQETTSDAAKKKDESVDKDAEILRLIEERRKMPKEEKHRLKELRKMYQRKKRVKRHHDIGRILEEFKGVRNIPRIKSEKKRVLITKIKNKEGEYITSRKGIADTFGEFYKRLIDVQTVLDNIVWKIVPNALPISSRRSGGIQENLPNNGSSCDVQNVGTKMPGVGNQNVDSDGGLHEGV